MKIKILKKWAFDQANVSVLINGDAHVKELRVSTFNLEDGKIVESKMSGEGVFINNLAGSLDKHTSTLPNVKEGSVLEYYYMMYQAGISCLKAGTSRRPTLSGLANIGP